MSAWSGTFFGAARGLDAALGHLALVAVAVMAGGRLGDPLRLGAVDREPNGHGQHGRFGAANLCLLALGLATAASYYASPMPRAGRLALVLVPGFLFLPRFVALAWPDAAARRRGLVSVALVVAVVAGWGLVGVFFLETAGASLPLGHHNLLAAFLVTLLPLAVLPWRHGGLGRLVAGAAALLGVAALALTGSLGGLLAFGAVALTALFSRHRGLAVALFLVALAVATPRLHDIIRGADPSALARQGYATAALAGVAERPLLGWGPGAAHWTLAEFLVPRPGVHPPDQVVADPHSLPLRLAYELGVPAFVLAVLVAIFFVRERRRARRDGRVVDAALSRAALAGLLGFALASLWGRAAAAPALPVAALLAAGAALAAEGATAETAAAQKTRQTRPAWLLGLLMLVLLVPLDLAHLAYDRARDATDEERREALERAVALDPDFPLYRWHRTLLEADPAVAARQARAAAEDARGLSWLWLTAGRLGHQVGVPWSEAALLRACELAPLNAFAPFRLATGAADGDPRAAIWARRAFLAEPRLLAATAWPERGDLLSRALAGLAGVEGVEGVDPGFLWEIALAREQILEASGPRRVLALSIDGAGAISPTLHAFRRLPWPARLDAVEIFAELLPQVSVEPATTRPETSPAVFATPRCSLPGPIP